MADKTDETIVDEVEKRLADLFGDDDEDSDALDAGEEEAEDTPAPEEDVNETAVKDFPVLEMEAGVNDIESSPLKGLKATVLSIEWEITDNTMDKFLAQVNELIPTYSHDRIIHMFLQLLHSVGRYIKAKKANADPDVVKLLSTTYAGLEETLLTKGISETRRKQLLVDEVTKFKAIKERITGKKLSQEGTKKVVPELKAVEKPPKEVVPGPEAVLEPTASAGLEPKPEEEPAPQVALARKGVGLGRKFGLEISAPLIGIAIIIYLYASRLTGISDQIDQLLQKILGVQVGIAQGVVFALLCGLLIVIGVGARRIGNGLSKNIHDLTQAVERINAGDKEVSIPTNAGGEIGHLAEAINRLKDTLQ